jgi:hypothetical protein
MTEQSMLAAGSDGFSICKGGLPMRKIGLALAEPRRER